jgi:hypothetical protein
MKKIYYVESCARCPWYSFIGNTHICKNTAKKIIDIARIQECCPLEDAKEPTKQEQEISIYDEGCCGASVCD